MTPEQLVEHYRESLLKENMQHYRNLFAGPLTHPRPDAYYLAIRDFFARLSSEDQTVLFSILRQTIIDTASSIFVVLDGHACLPGYTEDFSLRYGSDSENLNGDLQDLFLAAEEECEGQN